ncbi:hypothetical protein FD724_36950 (plasmid) [Nostoc sp. C057]|uniref:hypothetical protein n=1 Tax=Nostoc sp. C057 TaxID=2576903 RepID=UPI0015C3737A|nr:hypothetical protein [Nostoc sp. C057]QLE53493.1 hypothetical protein FD724_36950 [Nostoc sp. C057]
MSDSEDPKQATNNHLSNSQFGGGLINAESVNAERIGGDVYNIYFGKQQAASDSPAPSPNQKQRSQSQRDVLEKTYIIQSQKVASIINAWVIETDPSRKFQYEQQLQEEERILKELGKKLDAIEQQLQATRNYTQGHEHNQKLSKEADSYFEPPEPDNENTSTDMTADMIEKLKKLKPEAIVNSCSTHQEALSLVNDLWFEGTKIAKKGRLSEAVFLLEFGIAIAKIIDNIILWLAIDKDLEFIKAKLH